MDLTERCSKIIYLFYINSKNHLLCTSFILFVLEKKIKEKEGKKVSLSFWGKIYEFHTKPIQLIKSNVTKEVKSEKTMDSIKSINT